jgi:hypothetical protein
MRADRAGVDASARPGGEVMKKVDFYSLPRAVQDRLLDSLRGQFAPHPILAKPGPHRTARIWLAAAFLAAVLTASLAVLGYGNPASAFSLQATALVGLYALGCTTLVGGILEALTLQVRTSALPYAPAIYLFPSGVIDARTSRLHVYPMSELQSASLGAGGSLILMFRGARFELPSKEPAHLSRALELVEAARARLSGELDAKERFALDPLEPPAVASPLGPALPLARPAPLWERGRWAIAGVVGIALGAGLHHVRNRMSDDRMLALARAKDDVPAYQSYVARGRTHRELVAREWLPRAALKAAIAEGTVEAIDTFEQRYPENAIGAEVAAARHNALVVQFEAARAQGTLAALLSYADRHPDHGLGPAFEQAKHALYRAALSRAKAQLPAEDSEKTAAFLERLFAFAEKAGATRQADAWLGTKVAIRFGRAPSLTLGRADQAVSKNPMFNGPVSLPTRHFDKARLAREKSWPSDSARRFPPTCCASRPGRRSSSTATRSRRRTSRRSS